MPTSRQSYPARLYAPNRIRELREERGLSCLEVALRFDPPIQAGTINKLENRRMGLTLDYIKELARIFDCSPTEIISEQALDTSVRMLPVAGAIAAGRWREAVAMADEYLAVPGHLKGANLFVLRVVGDSMGNKVPDGGYIVVDPDQRDLMDGKLYAIMNGEGETTFKQFRASPTPRLVPLSANPEHKEIALGHEQMLTIGRIVHGGSDFD